MQTLLHGGLGSLIGLACAGLLLARDRGRERLVLALVPLLALIPLAAIVGGAERVHLPTAALSAGLVIALLARDRNDLQHSECALKLLWVIGAALAMSWAGLELLTLATGTPYPREQWAVLSLGLDRPFLWSTAVPLSLLAGLVLLGGAPFHFWVGDVLQGARLWLAPLAVAALQTVGARWLVIRTEGIEMFPEAADIARGVLEIGTLVALISGAATLLVQRRPERRIGTLASLNGALAMATLLAGGTGLQPASGGWAAHTILALVGATTLSRLLPVSTGRAAPGPPIARRHPFVAAVGLYAMCSLAGVPGTPGGRLWLEVARDVADAGRQWTLLALAAAWLVAFTVAIRQVREAFGLPSTTNAPASTVPWQLRASILLCGLGLAALGLSWIFLGGPRG